MRRGGLTLGVLDDGPLDGPPVVLLHGFPQRATAWKPTVEILNAAGIRTFALDQRGYAPGARPRGRRAYRMRELMGDAVALIAQIGRPVTLVGHDWGAAVAWTVAQRRPDLVTHLVAASVPHPAAFFAAMARSNQLAMSWYIGLFQVPVLPEILTRLGWMEWWLARIGMPAEALATWRTDFKDAGCAHGALGWYRALPFLEPDLTRERVTVPTTFVRGGTDAMLGAKGGELTRRYVAGPYRYIELPNASHWLMDTAPEEIARLATDGGPTDVS